MSEDMDGNMPFVSLRPQYRLDESTKFASRKGRNRKMLPLRNRMNREQEMTAPRPKTNDSVIISVENEPDHNESQVPDRIRTNKNLVVVDSSIETDSNEQVD